MEKDLVEIRMQSEYHFRRSCRELLGQETGNEFWKRCFCEACFQAIRAEVTGEWAQRNTPFDAELYRDKLLVVESYRQQYVHCVPHLIDLQEMLAEYRQLRKRYRYPGLPEPVQLRMACGYCLNLLMNMTPVRFLHSDEFLSWVQTTGLEGYTARMETLYHVWKHIARQAAEARRAARAGHALFFTLDTHGADYLSTREGKKLPVEHCLRGTEGWNLVPEVKAVFQEEDPACPAKVLVEKPTFGASELPAAVQEFLTENKGTVEKFRVYGVCTDICVISNAMLLRAFFPETPIEILAGLCAGVCPEAHETALKAMGACQFDVLA